MFGLAARQSILDSAHSALRWCCAVLLSFFLGYPTAGFGHSYPSGHGHANYGLSVPTTSSTGDYTVSWNGGQYMYLHESVDGGQSQVIYEGLASSFQVTGRADATYTYFVVGRACSIGGCWGIFGNEKSIVVAATPPPPQPQPGFDFDYVVTGGDLDGDGDIDLFLSSDTTSGPNPYVADTILKNDGTGSYTIVANPTSTELSIAAGWSTVFADVLAGDFNMDDIVDAVIGMRAGPFGGNAPNDLILFAHSSAGNIPAVSTEIDTGLQSFLEEIDNWISNPSYFSENAPLVTRQLPQTTAVGWYYFAETQSGLDAARLQCIIEHSITNCLEYIGFLQDVFTTSECISLEQQGIPCDRFGGHVFGISQTTVLVDVLVPDYSVFNSNSIDFKSVFEILNDVIDIEVIAGSAKAAVIEEVLERMFGIEVFGGVLGSGGGVLGSESDIDPNDLPEYRGVVILTTLLELAASTGDPQPSPRRRKLTEGEKALFRANGLDIKGMDKVKVANRGVWFTGFGAWDRNSVMAPNGHIYIPTPNIASMNYHLDYSLPAVSLRDKAIFIHEAAHVFDYRNNGCRKRCLLRNGTPLFQAPDYIYGDEWDDQQAWEDYNSEQRAEMFQDRFLLSNGQPHLRILNDDISLNQLNQTLPFSCTSSNCQ